MTNEDAQKLLTESLLKQKLHNIQNWNDLLLQCSEDSVNPADVQNVGNWLNGIFRPLD